MKNMKKLLSVLVSFGLVIGIHASAFAMGMDNGPSCPPNAQGAENGNAQGTFGCLQVFDLAGTTLLDEVFFPILPDPSQADRSRIGNPNAPGQGKKFSKQGVHRGQLAATFDPDPSIAYDLIFEALTDVTINLVLGEPIELTGAPTTASNEYASLTLEDMDGNGVVTFVQHIVGSVAADGGATLTNMGVDLDTAIDTASDPPLIDPSLVGGQFLYGGQTANQDPGPDPGAAIYWNYLEVNIAATISAGDKFILSGGFLEILGTEAPVATPEPGTLLLIGSGLVGLGVGARRRRK